MHKIAVLLSNRATYNRNSIFLQKLNKECELIVLVCSSLLKEEYSNVFNELNHQFHVIPLHVDSDTRNSSEMAVFSSSLGSMATDYFIANRYDLLIVIADRFELLPVAMSAAYLKIPICHIQAGEDSGNIDQKVRHAVTMLSDICFVSHHVAEQRVKSMGIKEVYNYGCPAIDMIKEALKGYQKRQDSYFISLFHPHTKEEGLAPWHFKAFIEATRQFEIKHAIKSYVFAPNNDPGYKNIIELSNSNTTITNIDGVEFIRLLAGSKMIVGNSSAGIREASYLGIPAVNIGNRQKDRITANNIIHCDYVCIDSILDAMEKAFILKPMQSTLFGSGNSSDKIVIKIKEFLNERS